MSTYIIRSEEIKQRAIDEIASLYKPMMVCIKPVNRSTAQNSYWWKLLDIIAEHTGQDAEYIKEKVKFICLPLVDVEANGKTYQVPISSAKATKEQFAKLIEATLALGMQLNLQMPIAAHFGLEER